MPPPLPSLGLTPNGRQRDAGFARLLLRDAAGAAGICIAYSCSAGAAPALSHLSSCYLLWRTLYAHTATHAPAHLPLLYALPPCFFGLFRFNGSRFGPLFSVALVHYRTFRSLRVVGATGSPVWDSFWFGQFRLWADVCVPFLPTCRPLCLRPPPAPLRHWRLCAPTLTASAATLRRDLRALRRFACCLPHASPRTHTEKHAAPRLTLQRAFR